MELIIDLALPALVVFIMTVVGLDLTYSDFTRVLRYPKLILIVLTAQWLLLPVAAALIVWGLALPPVFASGIILVAAAPIGAFSNYYSMLAGANLALAVSLTAVSSLIAVIATPIVAALTFELLLSSAAGFELPVGRALMQTLIGLLLPILAGMSARGLAPVWVARNRKSFQIMSLLAVAAVVGFVIVDQIAVIGPQLPMLIVASLLFSFVPLGIGWLIGRLCCETREDRLAVLFGFPARNLAFATLMAFGSVGRVDVASFAAILFVVQILLLVPLAMALQRRLRPVGR